MAMADIDRNEIERIREEYASGKYNTVMDDMKKYLQKHSGEVWVNAEKFVSQLKKTPQETINQIPRASFVKWHLLKYQTVESKFEFLDQLEQILAEAWYRGVNTGQPPDREAVMHEWKKEHSKGWRAHYVLALEFLVDKVFETNPDALPFPTDHNPKIGIH